jgi:hypothetical protein
MKAEDEDAIAGDDDCCDNGDDDEEPMAGNPSDAMSDVKLTSRGGMSYASSMFTFELIYLYDRTSLSSQSQSSCKIYKPAFVSICSPSFEGELKVHHSAIATYYVPNDLCGAGGLHHEFIRSTPSFHRHRHHQPIQSKSTVYPCHPRDEIP